MPMNVTFGLGQAVDLTSRRLVITRMPGAGDDDLPLGPSAANTLGGSIESHKTDLPSNQLFQAVLIDTKTTGEVSDPAVLNFQTGTLQFPGPGPESSGRLRILSMDEESSSSSSSISTSSSSQSSISTSSSSISTSSISTSSSSISTSSQSESSSSNSSSSVSSNSSSSQSSSSSSSQSV